MRQAPRASPQRVLIQRAVGVAPFHHRGVAPFHHRGGLQDFVLTFVLDFSLDRHAEQPLKDVEGRAALGVLAILDALNIWRGMRMNAWP